MPLHSSPAGWFKSRLITVLPRVVISSFQNCLALCPPFLQQPSLIDILSDTNFQPACPCFLAWYLYLLMSLPVPGAFPTWSDWTRVTQAPWWQVLALLIKLSFILLFLINIISATAADLSALPSFYFLFLVLSTDCHFPQASKDSDLKISVHQVLFVRSQFFSAVIVWVLQYENNPLFPLWTISFSGNSISLGAWFILK